MHNIVQMNEPIGAVNDVLGVADARKLSTEIPRCFGPTDCSLSFADIQKSNS